VVDVVLVNDELVPLVIGVVVSTGVVVELLAPSN